MKTLLIYESYAAKWYKHEPIGRTRVPNNIYPIDLYMQLALDGYSLDLYITEEKTDERKKI